jgi:hypothetical protein
MEPTRVADRRRDPWLHHKAGHFPRQNDGHHKLGAGRRRLISLSEISSRSTNIWQAIFFSGRKTLRPALWPENCAYAGVRRFERSTDQIFSENACAVAQGTSL